MRDFSVEEVRAAVARSKSLAGAANLMGTTSNVLTNWLARNHARLVQKTRKRVVSVPPRFPHITRRRLREAMERELDYEGAGRLLRISRQRANQLAQKHGLAFRKSRAGIELKIVEQARAALDAANAADELE